MTYDFSDLKVPTFPNINDKPIPPTASLAGNGSHVIKVINDLVNATETALNELEETQNSLGAGGNITNNWVCTENSYTASPNEYICFLTNAGGEPIRYLTLPQSTEIGNWVGVINTNSSINIEIIYNREFNGDYPQKVYFNQNYQLIYFIWTGEVLGWITNRMDIIMQDFGGGS